MVKILVVDDIEQNRYMLEVLLKGHGHSVESVTNGAEALEAARRDPPHMVISDILMPRMDGFALCRQWKTDEGLRHIPFVFYTATYTDPKDEAFALSLGAERFIVKPMEPDAFIEILQELVQQMDRSVAPQEPVSEDAYIHEYSETLVRKLEDKVLDLEREAARRAQVEEDREYLLQQVQEQARQMQQIVDTVPEGVLLLDAEDRVILANPSAQRDLEALTGIHVGEVLVSVGERPLSEFSTWPADASWHEITVEGYVFEVIARPIPMVSGSTGHLLVLRDITSEREMQQRMHQQERLTIIGQLAGGIAHDFNNLLTAIRGYTQLALDALPSGDPIRTDLEEVGSAANRAASLTNQLLIFSRKQVLQPQVLNLNVITTDMEKMLRRLIGEDIELYTTLDPALGQVRADPGQIEQVIMNLAVNARDAMPGGGKLTLETENVELDAAFAREHLQDGPGSYVRLAVSDTGTGMTQEVKAHLFEPFFTTKEQGKGTGLGLATVYGIVEQSGGHVEVYSEWGVGTTFKIYLPRIQADAQPTQREPSAETLPRGTETILLAEDEAGVRELVCRVLERQGYTVLAAHLPSEALALSQRHDGPIALLVSDVVMPEMGGRDLAERLVSSRPEIQVLYVSGYTDDAIAHHGVLEPGIAYLEKPFSLAKLVRKVREVLDTAVD